MIGTLAGLHPRAAKFAIAGQPKAGLRTVSDAKQIRHLRQILLWPVYLLPLQEERAAAPLGASGEPGPDNPWREVDDEFGDPGEFQERHYNEFVTFLPPVQRFLYGQGLGRAVRRSYGESPIRVMRRNDVAKVRLTLSRGDEPIELRDRPRRPLFLLRHRYRHPGLGGRRPTIWRSASRRRRCSASAAPIPPTGRRTAAAAIAPGGSSGCGRTARFSPLGLREAREVSVIRLPASRPGRGRALGVPALAAGAAPQRQARARALPAARILPHALYGLLRHGGR